MTQKFAQNSPSAHHCTTLTSYILATKARIDNRKKLLNSNISSTCLLNMVNFGPLTAEICWRGWGTAANLNGFRVLASRSTKLCTIFGLIHYIYIFGGSCAVTEFCQVQNSLKVQVLHSSLLAALLHGTRAVGVSETAAFSRERHIY